MRFIFFIAIVLTLGCQSKTAANLNRDLLKDKVLAITKPVITNHVKLVDGPPMDDGKPNLKIVKVVKDEKISRVGNPSSYQIRGKKYQVLKSARGYKEQGIASWYGTKFHKRKTSNGEIYDVYKMTAAHKTLPLPTYVKVKNLNNKKEIIVKVNDRGPFHKGRIIDLSYQAARELGIVKAGTAPVEVVALATKELSAKYYLQAGAFSKKETANTLKEAIAKLTSAPLFIEKYMQYYLVKAGPFNTVEKTEHLKKLLAKKGIADTISMLH